MHNGDLSQTAQADMVRGGLRRVCHSKLSNDRIQTCLKLLPRSKGQKHLLRAQYWISIIIWQSAYGFGVITGVLHLFLWIPWAQK